MSGTSRPAFRSSSSPRTSDLLLSPGSPQPDRDLAGSHRSRNTFDGTLTGAHRTWLDPEGFSSANLGKAPLDTPRRAMGHLRGGGVRFGIATDILAAGEGIETVLSVRQALLALPGIAALSGAHLAAIDLSPALRRLYVLRDVDPAGDAAVKALTERVKSLGIDVVPLTPSQEDFNEDLMAFFADGLRDHVRSQLAPDDVARFMPIRVQRDTTA